MKKMRHREVKSLAYDYTDKKWLSQDLKMASLDRTHVFNY